MTYSDPARQAAEPAATDPAAVLARLVTFSEIDAAKATLRRIIDLREAEHQMDASSRLDASGTVAANRPLLDALDQLTVVRTFRAVPDELVQAYRERQGQTGGQQ